MALLAPDVVPSAAFTSSSHKNPVAELKNGKVVFRQKPISFDKASETLQEIVKFREILNLRVQNQDPPLISIPDEHKPLIVKLAQESDKRAVPLAKQIRSTLLPGPGEVEDAHRLTLEAILPLPVVEHAIKAVMTRINYGLDGVLGQKIPAGVCVWRWEVQDAYKDWLPKSARDSAEARLAERVQASVELRAAFKNLSQAEQDVILDSRDLTKNPANDMDKSELDVGSANTHEHSSMDHAGRDTSDIADGETPADDLVPKGRMKKALDLEKVAKIKEKEEKKAQKAQKEKKQKEAQDRSRSIMVNFFGKAKPSTQDSPAKESNAPAGFLIDSDFQRTFKPFVLKKDVELAPYNWFFEKKIPGSRMTGVTHEEAIIIDDDTLVQGSLDARTFSGRTSFITPLGDQPATLKDFVEELRQSSLGSGGKARKMLHPRTHNPRSVRDTVLQLNEAEIAGDPAQVRHLLSVLRDRQLFPAKMLIFHDDSRPGYYGTWTRNSRVVGPRAPLDRDVLAHDYAYDSGEEWEDEGTGDADDVVDDGEDDEPDVEDADSDLDSWLVDDDEIVRSPLDLDEVSPPPLDLSMPPPKRKAENIEKRPDKKRKVVPLVPYVKGPCWESQVGQCQHDPFNVFRIQLFNDTPYPIDPFTFISVASEGRYSDIHSHTPLLNTNQPPGATAPSCTKRTANSAPKTTFPEAHLSTLFAKIADLATPSLTFLVESIYQDLRIHKIKKNAIEAKVREISEKSKDKKVWVVKQEAQALFSRGSVSALNCSS